MRGFLRTCIAVAALLSAVAVVSHTTMAEEAGEPAKPLAPAAKDAYQIQPFDILTVVVWPYDELKQTATVRPDGMVSYPFLGEVKVQGMTAGQLGEMITKSLEPYMKNPKVAVNIDGIRRERATVMGAVKTPGNYEIRAGDTIMDLISRAGGFAETSKKSDVGLIRAPKLITEKTEHGNNDPLPEGMVGTLHHINVATLLGKGEFPAEYFVKNGDVIYVPTGNKPDWGKISDIITSTLQITMIDNVINGN